MSEVEKQSPKTPENTTREPPVPIGFEKVPSLDEDSKCPSTKHTKHKDIWLIKVPADFDASRLSGKTVVLNGTQNVPIKQDSKGTKARFEVISKPIGKSVPGSFKVLLPSSNDASVWAAKAFVGDMSVIQSLSIATPDFPLPSSDHSTHVQAPDITCRWKPFGYKKPFSSTTKKARKKREKKNARNHKLGIEFDQKNQPSESTHKPEAERSEERKKHKKMRIKQEKNDDKEDCRLKSKKIRFEKPSAQMEAQVKIEKKSPVKEKNREKKKKEKESLLFTPLDVTVKTEPLSDEEGGTPRKKRKKEKRK